MPTIAPANYREIPFSMHGRKINIAGMAKPDWRGHNLEKSMEFIKEKNVNVIISLEFKKEYENAATRNDISYIKQHIPDFQPPTFAQCNEIYKIAEECASRGEKMAIHCTAGRGRTGTVLAALKIKEHLENEPQLHEYQSKSAMIKLGAYGGHKFILCSPLVCKAIEEVRGIRDSEDSVEVEAQIKMLCDYHYSLVAASKNQANNVRPIAMVSDDHTGIIKAKEVIECLTNQIKIEENSQSKRNLLKTVSQLKKEIAYLKTKNDNSATDALNKLIARINNIDANSLHNEKDQLILNNIQRELFTGASNTTMSFTDNLKAMISSRFIPIYIALSQLSKTILERFQSTAPPKASEVSPLVFNENKQTLIDPIQQHVLPTPIDPKLGIDSIFHGKADIQPSLKTHKECAFSEPTVENMHQVYFQDHSVEPASIQLSIGSDTATVLSQQASQEAPHKSMMTQIREPDSNLSDHVLPIKSPNCAADLDEIKPKI